MAIKKIKKFTQYQSDRLPDQGYYLSYYKFPDKEVVEGYCIMNGQCKYIHWQWGQEWNTLLWSCAPTRKKLKNPDSGERFEYFPTHDDMIKAHPELPQGYHKKAPNDI